jgi:hypothetical protein
MAPEHRGSAICLRHWSQSARCEDAGGRPAARLLPQSVQLVSVEVGAATVRLWFDLRTADEKLNLFVVRCHCLNHFDYYRFLNVSNP